MVIRIKWIILCFSVKSIHEITLSVINYYSYLYNNMHFRIQINVNRSAYLY